MFPFLHSVVRGTPPPFSYGAFRAGKGIVLTQALLWTAGGSGFTCLMTLLGAAIVFFLGRRKHPSFHRLMLGFAAGVMIAASMWSLLIPAIETAQELGIPGWIPAAGGSALGVAFLSIMDMLLPHLSFGTQSARSGSRPLLLALAITLHNIPEGMAVGISFSLAAQVAPETLPAALALAFGVGIQNFPEGAAIALPLTQEGFSRRKAFAIGACSGVVEPIAALLTVLVAGQIQPLMPWLLSFAAGAMLYVVAYLPKLHPYVTKNQRLQIAGFFIRFLLFEYNFHFLVSKDNLLNKDFRNALAFL